jgi:hypothetical protein
MMRFLRLRMRWPQKVRTVRILRMSEYKRGCVFLQFLQGPGFPSKTLVYVNIFQRTADICTQSAYTYNQ